MKTILIVEDDSFLQGLAAGKLAKAGFNVKAASSGEDAVKIIDTAEMIDCILLDIMLPGADGYSVLKKVRDNLKLGAIPVIVFSNLAEEKDIKKAKDLGATDFMIKSNFTLDELVEKISILLK